MQTQLNIQSRFHQQLMIEQQKMKKGLIQQPTTRNLKHKQLLHQQQQVYTKLRAFHLGISSWTNTIGFE